MSTRSVPSTNPMHRFVAAFVALAVVVTIVGQLGPRTAAGAAPPTQTPPGPWVIERLSVGPGGAESDGDSYGPSISTDGGTVAFETWATNLGSTPMSAGSVVAHSLASGTTEQVSVNASGMPYQAAREADVNADANVVVMSVTSSGERALVLRDRAANTSGNVGPGIGLKQPAISDAGDRVVFIQEDTNPFDDDNRDEVFLYDGRPLPPGESRDIRISNFAGLNDEASRPVISADGNAVAYAATVGGVRGTRVHDVTSRPVGEPEWYVGAHDPSLSADGRYLVTFRNDPATREPIVHRLDRVSGEEQVVVLPGNADQLDVSADGDVIAYVVTYTDDAGDRRTEIRTTNLATGHTEAAATVDDAPHVDLSADGQVVVFSTAADGLVAEDTNGMSDVFIARRTDSTAPTWPLGAALAADLVTSQTASLRWTAATDDTGIAGYVLSQDGELIADLPASASTFEVTGLTPETEYRFDVVAVDTEGNGSSPLARTVFTEPAPTVPGDAPLTATGSGGGVLLQWDLAVGDVAGYYVLRAQGDGELAPISDLLAPSTDSFHDGEVVADETYRYAVDIVFNGELMRYTVEASAATPPVAIDWVTWSGEGRLGSDVTVSMSAVEGWRTTAEVEYRTWFAEDGELLPEPRNATTTVPMGREWSEPNRYTGTFRLDDGVTEVTRVTGVQTDEATAEQRVIADRAPLPVNAALDVTLDAPDGSLAGSRIVVPNVGQAAVSGGGTTPFPVVPGGIRAVQVLSPKGLVLAEATVEAVAGRRAAITLTPALPATMSVNVVDQFGQPLVGAGAKIYDTDGTYIGGGTSGAGGRIFVQGEGIAGREVTVEVSPPASDPLIGTEQTVVLQPGANVIEAALTPLPKGSVAGTVTLEDGSPAAKARVWISQQVDGRSWSFWATADDEGRYTIEGLQGQATLSANLLVEPPTTAGPFEIGSETATVDLVLPIPSAHYVNLSVYTKTIDDIDWQGPIDLDWATAIHFGLTVHNGRTKIYARDDHFVVPGRAGDVVTICTDGREAGLTSDCAEVTLGDERQIPVELRMESVARVRGRVVIPGHIPGVQAVEVGKFTPTGAVERVSSYPILEGGFDVDIATPGRYRITVTGNYRVRYVDVDVAAGDRIDLGDVLLSGSPWSSFSVMNATRRVVMPGGRTDVRVQLHPGMPGDVRDATAKLTLPAGAEVVEGSVLLDGQPVAATVADGVLSVPLPDRTFAGVLDLSQSYVVHYQLQLTTAAPGTTLQSIAAVDYIGDNVGTPITALNIDVAAVTIDAGKRSASHTVTLSGLAPSGTTVRLMDGPDGIGEAVAGPGGRWTLTTELPDLGNGALHTIVGTIDAGGQVLSSEPKGIVVDERYPVLQQVTLERDGLTATFDPREGVARFPFVYRGQSLKVRAEFGGTGVVDGLSARVGGYTGKATQVDDHTWETTLSTSMNGLGAVGLDYEVFPEPSTLSSERRPSLDEVRRRLPAAVADVGEPTVVAHPPSGDTTSSSFNVPAPGLGEGGAMSGTMTLTRGQTYEPTAADLLAAKRTGTPIHGVTFDYSFQENEVVVEMSGYVPESELNDPEAGFTASSSLLPTVWARWGFRAAFSAAQGVDIHSTASSTSDKYQRLNNLLNSVMANCDPDWTRFYGEQLQELNEKALATDAMHAGLMLAGVLLAPGTFGVGTLVVWGVTWALDKQADYNMNSALDRMAKSIAADCPRPDNRPPDEPDRPDDDEDTIADPVWIHDPSGHVFEGVPSNRVQGATATLLYSPTPDGPFVPWDAEWFGQTNPLITDEQGAYGWDVPEGFWQVVYEKDGFETARSEVLEVLPPHFDVNVGMVSRTAPEVEALSALAGDGSAVDVVFTKPMELGTADAVSVVTADGTPVAGSVAPVDAENGPTGVFTKTFRFTPDTALVEGTELQVTVDAIATSYAGVPMAAPFAGTVTVAAPPPPESPVCTIVGTDGDDTLEGTAGDDVICGFDGNDVINGRGGNDTIVAGAGDDSVRGGAGADIVDGGEGNDVIRGDGGDDTLTGGVGDDTVQGGAGTDTLDGADGADIVSGGTGNDTLTGGAGNDVISGAAGDDIAAGGAGDDRLQGGLGNDTLAGGDGVDLLRGGDHDDLLDGGAEVDRVDGGPGHDGWKDLDEATATRTEYRY